MFFSAEPVPVRPATGPAARVDISLQDLLPDSCVDAHLPDDVPQNTFNNQNQPDKISPSEVQKLSEVPISDLIKFSTKNKSRIFDSHHESVPVSYGSTVGNLPQLSYDNIPDFGNLLLSSPMMGIQNSAVLPQLTSLMNSDGDNNDMSIVIDSTLIPMTVNEELSGPQGIVSNGISCDTSFESETMDSLQSVSVSSKLNEYPHSTSLSCNIPLLSVIGSNEK